MRECSAQDTSPGGLERLQDFHCEPRSNDADSVEKDETSLSSSTPALHNDRLSVPRQRTTQIPRCGTPGCHSRNFHIGPHSKDITTVGKKRSRKDASTMAPTQQALDLHRQSSYGSLSKVGHREAFFHATLQSKGSVLYLDGPDAALSHLLLQRGVALKRLVPVNKSLAVALSIEAACPGLTCTVADICELAATACRGAFSVAWFDMCGVDVGNYDVGELIHCAEVKFLTLSSRQLLASEQQSALCTKLIAV